MNDGGDCRTAPATPDVLISVTPCYLSLELLSNKWTSQHYTQSQPWFIGHSAWIWLCTRYPRILSQPVMGISWPCARYGHGLGHGQGMTIDQHYNDTFGTFVALLGAMLWQLLCSVIFLLILVPVHSWIGESCKICQKILLHSNCHGTAPRWAIMVA